MTIAVSDDQVGSTDASTPAAARPLIPLGKAARGYIGTIDHLAPEVEGSALSAAELERRLLELGFVEGARVEVLHEGLFGGDPIAVKLDDMRVALRRRDARGVMVRVETGS